MKYLLQLLVSDEQNTMQLRNVESVEGGSLLEVASKLSLMLLRQLDKERSEELLKFKEQVIDDIPF